MGRLTVTDHVFGYASLVAEPGAAVHVARLPGYRRVWGVATDNARALPGYKMYLRSCDGSRPAVFVAFVDIDRDPSGTVNGLIRQVAAEELERLDMRERNYDRIDVSGEIEGFEGRVWTYRGSAAGRDRLRRGRSEGRAVVSRDYLEKVRRGFAALGPEHESAFAASSCLDDLPVMELERVDLPDDPPAARDLAQPGSGSPTEPAQARRSRS